MKQPLVLLALAGVSTLALAASSVPAARHRYLIERTFPAHALDGLDDAAKAQVNAHNAAVEVAWIRSYANAEKTKTFCLYEGPSEAAVREAARRNALPVDAVVEVPVDLDSGLAPRARHPENLRRYVVERTFAPGALDGLDAEAKLAVNSRNDELGVRWVQSYANADRTKTWCIYEGPSEAAVRQAAQRNGLPIDRIVEVPVDLTPR
jgi:hypothetical protein